MDGNKKKKALLVFIIFLAMAILVAAGSTFAYFSITVSSNTNAISFRSAEFSLNLTDDTSLIKTHIIPSLEEYVDIASTRADANGFIKPYEDNEENLVTAGTACIDDNLNEICSIYTFTLSNPMTDAEIPLYITLNPSVNTFENLYFKVLDESLNEVIEKTHLVDDRQYTVENGERVYDANSTISPVVLTNINTTLAAAVDSETPTSVTYSIVMWIDENGQNQNSTDGGKMFAATLVARASGANGGGITGIISAAGTENNGD